MSESIQTTGGVLHPENIEFINNCICEVFNCEPSQITELQPLQKGLSNSVLSFKFNGGNLHNLYGDRNVIPDVKRTHNVEVVFK